jgi:hypothetical protein
VPGGADSYNISGNTFTVSPLSSASYSIIGTSSAGCVSSNTAVVSVSVNISPTISVNSGSICTGNIFTIVPSGADTYSIQGGSFTVSPGFMTSYTVTGTNTAGCSGNTAVSTIMVYSLPIISVNSGSICSGESFTIVPSGANTYTIEGGSNVVSPLSNSTYSVFGESLQGCMSTNNVISSITVNANPTITAISSATSLCLGETATLSALGASSFTWNSAITGPTIIVSPTLTTNYTVVAIDNQGCSGMAMVTQNVEICTGITAQEDTHISDIAVYPNPGAGLFNIESGVNTSLVLFDALGSKLLDINLEKGLYQLNITEFPKGIYLLAVKQSSYWKYVRLVKD